MIKVYTIVIESASNPDYWYAGHKGKQYDVVEVPNIDLHSWPGTDIIFKTKIPVAILPATMTSNKKEAAVTGFIHPRDCMVIKERQEQIAGFCLN